MSGGYKVCGENSCGGGGKDGQGRFGLAVWTDVNGAEIHSPEIISDRLLKLTFKLCDRANNRVLSAETRSTTLVGHYSTSLHCTCEHIK